MARLKLVPRGKEPDYHGGATHRRYVWAYRHV